MSTHEQSGETEAISRRSLDRAQRFARGAADELRGIDNDVIVRVRSSLTAAAAVLAEELAALPAQSSTRSRPWRLWAALPGGPNSLTVHGTYATREAAEKAGREWRKYQGGPTRVTNREDDDA